MSKTTSKMTDADQTGLRSPVGEALGAAKDAFWGVGMFSFFVNLLMLTGPLYMLQVYDRVLQSNSIETLIAISVLMVVLYLFMGVFDFLRSRVMVRVADKFEGLMTDKAFAAWLRGSAKGGKTARAAPLNDVSTLKQFLSGNAPTAFFDMPWVIPFIALIFYLHWTLGILAVVGALIIFVAALFNNIRMKKPLVESLKMRRMEQAFAAQAQRNAEAIEAMGMTGNIKARWKAYNEQGGTDGRMASDRQGGTSAFTKSFRMFLQSAMLGAGGALAVKGIITPGAMIAGSIILGRALAPIQMAVGQWRSFGSARDAYGRLNEFYIENPELEPPTQLPAPQGVLTVEGVTAAPPGGSKAVLANLNFAIKPGQGLGVIGPSASGKSTLAKLLTGVWRPQRGAIRIDGATFDQWDRDTIGKHVGYLPQTVELFDGTITENIARFDPNATDEAVVEAAKWAGVHDMILRLSDGYDTRVGLGNTVLSGGQLQRVALARALYGDPVLIVMDEPNANLDPEGDAALTRAISIARKRQKSVIVMAHRPSAIAAVDLILSLRNGQQEAFGPKEEVMAKLKEARVAEQEAMKAAQQKQNAGKTTKPQSTQPRPVVKPAAAPAANLSLAKPAAQSAGRKGFMLTGKPSAQKPDASKDVAE